MIVKATFEFSAQNLNILKLQSWQHLIVRQQKKKNLHSTMQPKI